MCVWLDVSLMFWAEGGGSNFNLRKTCLMTLCSVRDIAEKCIRLWYLLDVGSTFDLHTASSGLRLSTRWRLETRGGRSLAPLSRKTW